MESEIILGPPIEIGGKGGGAGEWVGLEAALTAYSIALTLLQAKSQMRDFAVAGAAPSGDPARLSRTPGP